MAPTPSPDFAADADDDGPGVWNTGTVSDSDLVDGEGVAGEPRRGRRWPRVVAGVVGTLALLFAGLLFWGNTDSLSFPEYLHADPVAPGELAAVEIDGRHCVGPLGWMERKTLFGRWQQTHVGQKREIRHWWQISIREGSSNSICLGGPVIEVPIPADITWSPVAICTLDLTCVLVEIDLSQNHS